MTCYCTFHNVHIIFTADKKYPNWSERNDNGEWGIGLDKFDDMYKVILEIIEYTSCDEATEQMLDDILFGIDKNSSEASSSAKLPAGMTLYIQ